MRYSRGDVVEFKDGSNEKHTGEVRFVEEDYNENLLYVDSFSGWAYKVPEKRIISRIVVKNPSTYSERNRFARNLSKSGK
jgi:signal peptidase I